MSQKVDRISQKPKTGSEGPVSVMTFGLFAFWTFGGFSPGTQVIFVQNGNPSEQNAQLDKSNILLSRCLILDKCK